jgi:hypothetical protein
MKKFLILLFAALLLLPAIAEEEGTKDEIELGIALTPMSILKSKDEGSMEDIYDAESGVLGDNILGLHAGYSFMWLFYASVDANVMPPWWIEGMTGYYDYDTGERVQGIMAPGFITFANVGVRPTFGPIMVMATIGINYMYIHSAYTKDEDLSSGNKAGMNLRVGAGYKFDMFSVSLIGTSVYPDFKSMRNTFKGLFQNDEQAIEDFTNTLIPSIAVYIHL